MSQTGLSPDAQHYYEENVSLRENVEELRKINNDAFEQLTEAHQRIRELEESTDSFRNPNRSMNHGDGQ